VGFTDNIERVCAGTGLYQSSDDDSDSCDVDELEILPNEISPRDESKILLPFSQAAITSPVQPIMGEAESTPVETMIV
jgi:hypothetical protein